MSDVTTERKDNSILEELWAVRDAHAKKFNQDLRAIFDDYKRIADEMKEEGYVFKTLPPQKVEKRTGTDRHQTAS